MGKTFQLDIALPEAPLPSRTVTAIDVPAANGRLTVLAHHQPLIAALNAGRMTVTNAQNQRDLWRISKGALQIKDNTATLLVREAVQEG